MITPYRKPAGGELFDWQKEYNRPVNKIRWIIEQVISHRKNWTIMHTDYRCPLKTFATTISAAVGLHFYRTAWITSTCRPSKLCRSEALDHAQATFWRSLLIRYQRKVG